MFKIFAAIFRRPLRRCKL